MGRGLLVLAAGLLLCMGHALTAPAVASITLHSLDPSYEEAVLKQYTCGQVQYATSFLHEYALKWQDYLFESLIFGEYDGSSPDCFEIDGYWPYIAQLWRAGQLNGCLPTRPGGSASSASADDAEALTSTFAELIATFTTSAGLVCTPDLLPFELPEALRNNGFALLPAWLLNDTIATVDLETAEEIWSMRNITLTDSGDSSERRHLQQHILSRHTRSRRALGAAGRSSSKFARMLMADADTGDQQVVTEHGQLARRLLGKNRGNKVEKQAGSAFAKKAFKAARDARRRAQFDVASTLHALRLDGGAATTFGSTHASTKAASVRAATVWPEDAVCGSGTAAAEVLADDMLALDPSDLQGTDPESYAFIYCVDMLWKASVVSELTFAVQVAGLRPMTLPEVVAYPCWPHKVAGPLHEWVASYRAFAKGATLGKEMDLEDVIGEGCPVLERVWMAGLDILFNGDATGASPSPAPRPQLPGGNNVQGPVPAYGHYSSPPSYGYGYGYGYGY